MLKMSKYWHFSMEVVKWNWSKNGHYSNFFLGNIDQENVFYDILERKNAFLGYKNNNFKKSKYSHFSKGFPMVLVQKWPFFKLFFLGNRILEIVFYDILERQKSLFRPKKKKFKKSKNWHFSKCHPWLWSKNGHFPNFFYAI